MAELAAVPEVVSAVADTASSLTETEASQSAASATVDQSTPPPAESVSSPSETIPNESNKTDVSTDNSPSSHPQPLEPNVVVTQNFTKDTSDNISLSPSENFQYPLNNVIDPLKDQAMNTHSYEPDFSQSMNMMSGIKDYFNQPLGQRSSPFSNISNPKTSFDQSVNSLSKLTGAMMLGPRLSVNPTINIGSNQKQQPLPTQGVGSINSK